jgi:hypothetical protein
LLVGLEVEAAEGLEGADVEPAGIRRGGGAGADALDVHGLALGVETAELDPADEAVVVVDVEDEYAVAAVFDVIAHAGLGDVEKVAIRLSGRAVGGAGGGAEEERGEAAEDGENRAR